MSLNSPLSFQYLGKTLKLFIHRLGIGRLNNDHSCKPSEMCSIHFIKKVHVICPK